MKKIPYRECPTCSSQILKGSYRKCVKWCLGGCAKLVCGECNISGYCSDCYIGFNSYVEIDIYEMEKRTYLT